MSLMRSFWQLADLHVSFMRVPTLLKVWQLQPANICLCCCCSLPTVQKVQSASARIVAQTICMYPGYHAGHGTTSVSGRLPCSIAVRKLFC